MVVFVWQGSMLRVLWFCLGFGVALSCLQVVGMILDCFTQFSDLVRYLVAFSLIMFHITCCSSLSCKAELAIRFLISRVTIVAYFTYI